MPDSGEHAAKTTERLVAQRRLVPGGPGYQPRHAVAGAVEVQANVKNRGEVGDGADTAVLPR